MDAFQAVILAAIQGLTEFLPVSSSGHLVLPQTLLGWADQGLAFDVAVHVGSLLAVLWYFRVEVAGILKDWFGSFFGGGQNENSRLGWMVIVATIPAVVAGLIFNDFIELNLRTGYVLATTTLVFGVILGLVDRYAKHTKHIADIGLRIALIVGFAQAIIPDSLRTPESIQAMPDGGRILGIGSGWAYQSRFSLNRTMDVVDVEVYPRASAVLRLANREFSAGRHSTAELAQPVYLRDSVAWQKS